MKYSVSAIFFLALGIFLTPSQVRADLKWELQSAENQLTLSGSCDNDVHIELYESDNFELEPLYTATAACIDNVFTHDDNLLKWDIADGEYKLVVESDRHTVRDFTLKEPPVTTEEALAREAREKGLPAEVGFTANQVFENAQASFGSKLYSLETDLITMQEALKDTTYPEFIKVGLSGALGIVEGATKKLADAFFIVEQRDFVDSEASIESLETVPESVVTPVGTETPLEDSTLETVPEQSVEELPLTEPTSP